MTPEMFMWCVAPGWLTEQERELLTVWARVAIAWRRLLCQLVILRANGDLQPFALYAADVSFAQWLAQELLLGATLRKFTQH